MQLRFILVLCLLVPAILAGRAARRRRRVAARRTRDFIEKVICTTIDNIFPRPINTSPSNPALNYISHYNNVELIEIWKARCAPPNANSLNVNSIEKLFLVFFVFMCLIIIISTMLS
jgi:hypothetical protein